ncbi:MAG: ROK family protein [Armatimonadota bacterium]
MAETAGNPSPRCVIGVDLGGTNARAALIDPDGKIVAQARRPSLQDQPAEATLRQIGDACEEAIREAGVERSEVLGVGIGLPGIMDSETGICFWSPNFPHWKDVPIGPAVSERLGVPVYILNDAKCAALGELCYGAGRGVRNMVMITLGTGIGGAFVVDGRLLLGPNGSIGEVGHHTIDPAGRRCGCGNFGCWEAMCARDAIIERAERKLQGGRPSRLRELGGRGGITPELVSRAASEGDAVALEVLEEIGCYIGIGATNLINMLNPERFVIGGGISAAGAPLFDPIVRTIDSRAVPLQRRTAEIVPALLGDNAGVMGAAALVLDRVGNVTDAI